MDSHAEHIRCIMEAIDHGLSRQETLEECPSCSLGFSVSESLRHDDMGWAITPSALSEMP